MQKEIRVLGPDDSVHIQNIQTSVVDDYIPKSFPHLIEGPHVLYGLFVDGQLASIAGYTLFADELVMLGRLRSDVRFHGRGFATELMAYIRDIVFENPNIKWVGANTQLANQPTQRVLHKLGFTNHILTYGAVTDTVKTLETGVSTWHKINSLKEKHKWLDQLYPAETYFFPYECFYLLPASKNLFTDEIIDDWEFYESHDQTRVIIMKHDKKRKRYVHVVYPWDDLMEQPGLWETITHVQKQFIKKYESDVSIWMELSERGVNHLPNHHPFDLPSPWTIQGVYSAQKD